MSLKQDILSSGSSAVMAQAIVGSIQNGISAAGTNQSTATKLGCAVNFVSTVASGTGVMLPVMFDGDECVVVNEGANTLSIYPTVGNTIDSESANAAVTLSSGGHVIFKGTSQRNYKRIGAFSAMLNVEDQALTGGVIVTSKSLGTISSGTVTPDPGDRPLQHYTNNGAHTLAPSANKGSILVDVTNAASAGAITTSGFTKVTGDAFTTTNGHKFRCNISIGDGGSLLQVQALQ